MTDPVVEINNLSRSFGKTKTLDCIDFQASRGSVRIFGEDPVKQPERVLKNIGYLSEDRDIPDWLSIGELMLYTSAYHSGWDPSYTDELLDTFSLDPIKKLRHSLEVCEHKLRSSELLRTDQTY